MSVTQSYRPDAKESCCSRSPSRAQRHPPPPLSTALALVSARRGDKAKGMPCARWRRYMLLERAPEAVFPFGMALVDKKQAISAALELARTQTESSISHSPARPTLSGIPERQLVVVHCCCCCWLPSGTQTRDTCKKVGMGMVPRGRPGGGGRGGGLFAAVRVHDDFGTDRPSFHHLVRFFVVDFFSYFHV